jgi:glycosyltransferase involved in cell wall biosynthesis
VRFAVVLNTFNRAGFLPYVLHAWARQGVPPFTMILADDGSEDATAELVRTLGPRLPYPVVHVRHERLGHRRAEILNKAVHVADCEPLLFTDADCLPCADLLAQHARDFRPDRMLVGGYVRLSPEYTATVTTDTVQAGDYERQLGPAQRRRLRWQHWKHRFYIALRKRGRPHVMGLNMVIPRAAFVRINGYDNEFRGWGRADGDLRERLKQAGVRPFSNWHRAITCHLHHPPDPTKRLRGNDAYADRARIPMHAVSGFAQVQPQVVWRSGA